MSWGTLRSIRSEAVELAERERTELPVACPDCGEPLLPDSRGVLGCRFDGWRSDGLARETNR